MIIRSSSFMSCLLDSCRSRCRVSWLNPTSVTTVWSCCLLCIGWGRDTNEGAESNLAVWCLLMSGNCWSAQLYSAQKSSFFGPISKLQLKGCYEIKHTTFSSTSAPYCSPVKVSVLYLLFGGSSWTHLTMKLSGLLWVDVGNFCPQLTSLQVLGQLQVTAKINDISFEQSCWRVCPN